MTLYYLNAAICNCIIPCIFKIYHFLISYDCGCFSIEQSRLLQRLFVLSVLQSNTQLLLLAVAIVVNLCLHKKNPSAEVRRKALFSLTELKKKNPIKTFYCMLDCIMSGVLMFISVRLNIHNYMLDCIISGVLMFISVRLNIHNCIMLHELTNHSC